jgi:hypothetical protein
MSDENEAVKARKPVLENETALDSTRYYVRLLFSSSFFFSKFRKSKRRMVDAYKTKVV